MPFAIAEILPSLVKQTGRGLMDGKPRHAFYEHSGLPKSMPLNQGEGHPKHKLKKGDSPCPS